MSLIQEHGFEHEHFIASKGQKSPVFPCYNRGWCRENDLQDCRHNQLFFRRHPIKSEKPMKINTSWAFSCPKKTDENRLHPTLFRVNYLTALKSMTHNGHTAPLIRTLDFAQQYTSAINWTDFSKAREMLERTNAFMDATEADNQGIRLALLGAT